ncbi:MAG: cytochrome c-type biogenesis protein CcmH [Proteobacteria bacterium]|nr:cytochrome c-type biogenesis protein CcmH [Pseudomonadota bacterium]
MRGRLGHRSGVRGLILLISTALLLGLAALAAAQSSTRSEPEAPPHPDWAYGLAHDLMSPFCPGRTLAECPSPQADELRLWILTQAAAGASQEEVEEALYARFGDAVRSTPRAEGWGLTAYAVPIGGFLLGGGIVVFVLRRMVAGGQGAPAATPSTGTPPASDPELERLLDEELGD